MLLEQLVAIKMILCISRSLSPSSISHGLTLDLLYSSQLFLEHLVLLLEHLILSGDLVPITQLLGHLTDLLLLYLDDTLALSIVRRCRALKEHVVGLLGLLCRTEIRRDCLGSSFCFLGSGNSHRHISLIETRRNIRLIKVGVLIAIGVSLGDFLSNFNLFT